MNLRALRADGGFVVSIGIFAWNEESGIRAMLESLFSQSLFEKLEDFDVRCEVLCMINGCSDRTPEITAQLFERELHKRHNTPWLSCRVENLVQRGKLNAWNQFVHTHSNRESKYLIMMDADIQFHGIETLVNLLKTLLEHPEASVAVDEPYKDIAFKPAKNFRERLSLTMSRMTKAAEGQLCGQLYAIRAEVARRIFLPRDLAACEDGFLKAIVCTNFLTEPNTPGRIRVAKDAAHTFEAYTSPKVILKNQKRQIMGQTIVHLLVDKDLKELPLNRRQELAVTLREKESQDPAWIKKLISTHLAQTRLCWRLHPGLLSQRFMHLKKLTLIGRLKCLPAAVLSAALALVASFLAWRSLKKGVTDYWPKAVRRKDLEAGTSGPLAALGGPVSR